MDSRKSSFYDVSSGKGDCENLAYEDSNENLWDNFDYDDDWPSAQDSKVQVTSSSHTNQFSTWKNKPSRIVTFFRSLINTNKQPRRLRRSEKVKSSVTSVLEMLNKVEEFLDQSLTPLRSCAQDNCFPKMMTPVLEISSIKKVGQCSHFSLPVVEAWTATYLLHTFRSSSRSGEYLDDESTACFQELLFSLCWEMQTAKLTGHHFYTALTEFVSSVNRSLEDLKRILINSDFGNTADSISLNQLSTTETRLQIDIKMQTSKRKKNHRTRMHILKANSTFEFNFPILFSVRNLTQRNGYVVPREFSRLCPDTKEAIIKTLFESTTESLMELHTTLRGASTQIIQKGLLEKASSSADFRKPVTVASSLKAITRILQHLAFCKKKRKLLEKAEKTEIFYTAMSMLTKWNNYVRYAQWVLLSFYELCDMISICYSFSLYHIHIDIPDIYAIRKYIRKSMKQTGQVSSKSKSESYRYSWSEELKETHKNSAIEELMGKVTTEGLRRKHNKYSVWYHKQMLSTRYHRALQQYPLEVDGQYDIILRTAPDLERVDSFMILPFIRSHNSET